MIKTGDFHGDAGKCHVPNRNWRNMVPPLARFANGVSCQASCQASIAELRGHDIGEFVTLHPLGKKKVRLAGRLRRLAKIGTMRVPPDLP